MKPSKIEYQTPQLRPNRWQPIVSFLWCLILFNVYAGLIMSLVFLVLGVFSLSHPIDGLMMFGQPVNTTKQVLIWIGSNFALVVITATVATLHIRGKLWWPKL